METEKRLEIVERDEAGDVTVTYVHSTASKDGTGRLDVILPKQTKSPWQRMLDVFLPTGYPNSVTDDYLEYQIYDSLQAFSSSIAGLLSSRAVLSSVGVGDSSASPTAALLLSILQESAGRIATIIFAHRFGTSLEPECKMYRLLADVLNDLAFVLDCLSPAFPKAIRVIVLSFSSVLRALCGVAAGSAKASLSAHFARWGNLGELNAKDSSQETVISLLGMLFGSLVVSWITTPAATWTTLILLLSIHLETNRRAVRAVNMRTLNRQRATIVFHQLRRGHVPSPEVVSQQERIFERDGVLRRANGQEVGYCTVGASMKALLNDLGLFSDPKASVKPGSNMLEKLLSIFNNRPYIMWRSSAGTHFHYRIVIEREAKPTDILVAWWHALLMAEHGSDGTGRQPEAKKPSRPNDEARRENELEVLASTAAGATELLQKHESELRKVGWDLDVGALETMSSTRISIRQ